MTDFEGQIAVNSDSSIGIICHRGTWGLKVQEACNRAGYNNITKVYTDVVKLEQSLEFDVIFIDENYYSSITGAELLEQLLSNKIIKATSAIIMVGEQRQTLVHNYDPALVLLDVLPSVFSQSELESKLAMLLMAQRTFFAVMSFVSSGKLVFAYKALINLGKSRVPKQLIIEYCKLQVNLAFEIGKYQQVLEICQKPQLRDQDWTIWPRFKANYELGNWQYCEDSLQQESFVKLPSGPMKLFWQLRLLVEFEQYEQAIELLQSYPKQDMPLSVIRLVFAILSSSGQWQQAQQFIARKVRLAHNMPHMQAVLLHSQCTVYLQEYYLAESTSQQAQVLDNFAAQLEALRQHKMALKFEYSIALFDIYLQLFELNENSEPALIQQLSQQLKQLEQHITSPLLRCRLAYAWYLLGQHEHCFTALLQADKAFGYTPFGCERLLLALLFKRTFNDIYPADKRAEALQRLGQQHFAEQRYKLACKAYSRSLQQGRSEHTLQLLAEAMSCAGMSEFAGFEYQQIAKAS